MCLLSGGSVVSNADEVDGKRHVIHIAADAEDVVDSSSIAACLAHKRLGLLDDRLYKL